MSSHKRKTEPVPAKPRKKTRSSSYDDVFEAAEALAETLVHLPKAGVLSTAVSRIVKGGKPSPAILAIIERPIKHTDSDDDQATDVKNLLNEDREKLATLYRSELEYANAIPPPSEYAQHSVWADWQQKATAILCLRPTDKQGLPLCVLDNIFRQFQREASAPLPSDQEDARRAMNAAFNLCHSMPNSFALEDDRSDMFDECLDPILPRTLWRKKFYISAPAEFHTGQAGRAYEVKNVVYILREDKVEPGSGGDAYMQASRAYQLYVEAMRAERPEFVEHGVPMFLLCLLGPILLICGGFYDMKSTIVEPLAQPCLVFGDCQRIRQEALARQLFALKRAVDTLRNRSPDTIDRHLASVPRVYPTFTTEEDGGERGLTFLRPLTNRLPQPLLFIAAGDSRDPSTVRLVKLVFGKYGAEVHRLLASRRLAPALYGHKSLEGAPTAYIMEYLCPPTPTESGWVTLFDFLRSKGANQHAVAIWTTLDKILRVMEEAKVVHGDLRPNNIMLEVDSSKIPVRLGQEQGLKLKVVDFDWGGKSGEVKYPLQRNEEITWPAAAGMTITSTHDRDLVSNWWPEGWGKL